MSDFLSQEEINALLKANNDINASSDAASGEEENGASDQTTAVSDALSAVEIDALGEVGNISMATAATTLSTLLSKSVDITTPTVSITTFQELVNGFKTPFVALQIQFAGDLSGTNVLVIGVREAVIIARLMMMQDVDKELEVEDIGEMELSAVSEAMNQMIGSASTAISTMLSKFIDIAPPITTVGKGNEVDLSLLSKDEEIVQIVFKMTIEDLIDSKIMQIYSLDSAKSIVKAMMGELDVESVAAAAAAPSMFDEMPAEDMPPVFGTGPLPPADMEEQGFGQMLQQMPPEQAMAPPPEQPVMQQPPMQPQQQTPPATGPMMQQAPPQMPPPQMPPQGGQPMYQQPMPQQMYQQQMYYDPQYMMPQKPQFVPLTKPQRPNQPKNIELILDVPMEMSVVLGKAQRSVKQILALGPGSIIELNKYAEEPLDIFVNGMLVGQGEVVVIEEKFGIRVNSIISTKERAESLGAK